jgi:hypothetical protein
MISLGRRTKVSVIIVCLVLVTVVAFFFQAKIVLATYDFLYKGKVQRVLDTANKDLDYPFALLGVKDNHGPAYRVPAYCYHNEPPAVEKESVGCLASLHADKRVNGEQDIAGLRQKMNPWADELQERLDQYDWQAMQYDSALGITEVSPHNAVRNLKKDGYHFLIYEKNVNGVNCRLTISADTEALRDQDRTVPSLFMGGSLFCARSTDWVL